LCDHEPLVLFLHCFFRNHY